jgi:hypothetical protein
MNLDFLDVLSQPPQKHREQMGTPGTACILPAWRVPSADPASGNDGNKKSVLTAGAGICTHLFPVCSQSVGTEKPSVYAVVPAVPSVPAKNEHVLSTETRELDDLKIARIQVSRWLGARCARSRHVWGSEKSLYHDYREWCQRRNQLPWSSTLFCSVLNESFDRELDGWQGLSLAADFAASRGIG